MNQNIINWSYIFDTNIKKIIKIQSIIRKYIAYKYVKYLRIENLLQKLLTPLTMRIKQYHNLFSLPLIAEQWEETLHCALLDIGYITTWKPNRSHKIAQDMRIVDIPNFRISCKSGQFVYSKKLNSDCVYFNGSRTSSFDTLEQKINHLCQNNVDYYFMLAKNKIFDKTYKLLVFESNICNVGQLQWTTSDTEKSWNGVGSFIATINKSLSSQLWTTLPLYKIQFILDIDCR